MPKDKKNDPSKIPLGTGLAGKAKKAIQKQKRQKKKVDAVMQQINRQFGG